MEAKMALWDERTADELPARPVMFGCRAVAVPTDAMLVIWLERSETIELAAAVLDGMR